LNHLLRLIALIGLISMGALRTGIRAQAPTDRPIDLWRMIRAVLTTEKADTYFKQIKDAEIPPMWSANGSPFGQFAGKVVSQPSPKILIVNVDNPGGDATLKLDNALKGVDPGTLVYFTGIVDSWVKEPYMLTLRADDFVLPANASPPRPPR
jgi:hypothetical protein